MKDDYLWDGSGDPDPDIEELEKALGSLRFQARPLDARFEQQLSARRPFFWLKYAAAAMIVMALARRSANISWSFAASASCRFFSADNWFLRLAPDRVALRYRCNLGTLPSLRPAVSSS